MEVLEKLIKEESLKIEDKKELVFDRIPEIFQRLNSKPPIRINEYFESITSKKNLINELIQVTHLVKTDISNENDFSGMYVFYHDNQPFYVGISRNVIRRINQHLKGKSHFNATLAHKLCRKIHPLDGKTRKDYHSEKEKEITEVQAFLKTCDLKLFPVQDPNELYLLEVYSSLILKTPFNDFKTH